MKTSHIILSAIFAVALVGAGAMDRGQALASHNTARIVADDAMIAGVYSPVTIAVVAHDLQAR